MTAEGIINTDASLVTYDSAKVLEDDGQVSTTAATQYKTPLL
ncbi:hypothetical protein [Clostridium sp.]